VVARIIGNRDGWDYDNCKVRTGDFTAAQLMTVLRPFVNKITCGQAMRAWLYAVKSAHASAVDGMIRTTAAACCVDEFKRQLGAETEKTKSGNSQPEK
jgi:hypothetical protein